MPWSNQNGGGGGPWGGGGNNGGDGGGPWGNGPKRPNGGGGNPPDIEEMLRQTQDKFNKAVGGGSSPFIFILAFIALAIFWGMQAIYTVQPDERGVELRFGKPKEEVAMPGLHVILWPLETVEIANISEREITSGSKGRSGSTEGLMLSGDQNIVDVEFKILYNVSEPAAYLFNVARPEDTLRQISESAMREIVGRRPAQDIFRDNRDAIANEVQEIVQNSMDSFSAGISINTVSIEDAAPPREVADAFDEVQRAEQDEDRFVEEANQYANQKLGQARGQAAKLREEAAGYKDRVVNEANGEAARFISIYDEYKKAPDVTRQRLYLETMESVLGRSNKVIIEQGGNAQGVVPYLPLNELNSKSRGN
ncbi:MULTISPECIES: FtsH protease activity modulator HflK [unclassified Lentilitoribacter]|jgi:membrane protease subunit HflK|uniref:FtsH protease activity modulator HflK n=1 Tax=unclassified Lentilitoribacter TaxID=2647570 RepID=UPI0013A6F6EC|nr:FtsH protease activity modulator HflK [Lentilitoribacter sp. Alg239-R112]